MALPSTHNGHTWLRKQSWVLSLQQFCITNTHFSNPGLRRTWLQQLIGEVLMIGQGVLILNGDCIKGPVVHTKPQRSIGFLHKQHWCPPGLLEGLMAPASNSSSSYYLIKSCSFGLWRYIFLAIGSVPGLTYISCTSPSPLSGGAVLGKSGGNTPLNSFNRWSKTPLCSSGRPKRCGTAPSGRAGSLYNNS